MVPCSCVPGGPHHDYTCKAWTNGEVHLEMACNAYYTNYEIALINTWFAEKAVYPELFGDIGLTEKTNEFTKTFLARRWQRRFPPAPPASTVIRKAIRQHFSGNTMCLSS